MENLIKCSSIKHSEINALYYCQECNVYMCNKCSNFHSELLSNHHLYELGKDKKKIFTGLCKEEEHKIELKFYCKTHNVLCCAACITKIKGEGNGQHTDCEVCFIKDIEEEIKNKLKENIKYLEEFSNEIENSINELKKIYEKINKDKEELKMKISNIFTKIRNSINEREDQLLSDIDNEYKNLFFKEDIIKLSEKLPNEVNLEINLFNSFSSVGLNLITEDISFLHLFKLLYVLLMFNNDFSISMQLFINKLNSFFLLFNFSNSSFPFLIILLFD
jgi:hypothetical protein